MGIKFEGQVLKFGNVDKCNRKFAPDCKITFPEKIPVAYNFDMDEIIGHADISKVEDGLKGVVLKHRRAIWHKSESGWFSVIF